jgi:integrase
LTVAVDEDEIERHARNEIISPSASSSSTFSHPVNEEEERRIYLVTDGIKSRQTKKTYLSLFKDFLRTIGSSDLKTLLDFKPSVIESKIISHIEHLKERKLSYSSIQVSCAAILHFFDINDVNLNTRKVKRFFPEDESDRYSTDRPYSMDEIKQILDKCDIRSKLIILLMESTGMRIGALHIDEEGRPGIRIGDLKKIDEFGLYMIWVYSWSKSDRYYTFCTPECAAAIDAYLDYRRKFGEELNDKSPLIREQFNIDNPFTANAPRFLSSRMMTHIFDDVLKRSGVNQLKPGQKRRDVMTSHGFRKFFITECDKANISYTVREFLSGHKLPNLDPRYNHRFRNEEDMLFGVC